jgi:peptidoglycan/LPS O-acetylase OafA/YrhL
MKKYYPEIDGLRAIAVLAVVVCHINEVLLPCIMILITYHSMALFSCLNLFMPS